MKAGDMDDMHLALAGPPDIEDVLPLVAAYHEFEGIPSTPAARRSAIKRLLDDRSLGEIWLMERGSRRVGYLAVCFGYSIEFNGRDAFLDELYVAEDERGRGLGKWALGRIADRLGGTGIKALHLEVAQANSTAKGLYSGLGFADRSKYHLMSLHLSRDDQAG